MDKMMAHLTRAAKDGASDVFFVPGGPVSYKLDGQLIPLEEARVSPKEARPILSRSTPWHSGISQNLLPREMTTFRSLCRVLPVSGSMSTGSEDPGLR